jgi:hypothetical protein
VTTASLAELASMSARQRLSQRAISIQSTLICALTAALAPEFARQRLFTRENKKSRQIKKRGFLNKGTLFLFS